MKCPRCGKQSEATGKKWKFGQFDVEGYHCAACDKKFNAYYKGGKLSHTVPKAK